MKWIGNIAKIGNSLLTVLAGFLILLLLGYGTYCLYDQWQISQQGFGSSELMKFKPYVDEEEPLSLIELKKINDDVQGWICIDDTNVDYPLLIGETDFDYLEKDALGNFVMAGSIFMSHLNNRDLQDMYLVIYGHNLENGSMFGDIVKYNDMKFFNEHRDGYIQGIDETYNMKVFAYMRTDCYNQHVYQPFENDLNRRNTLIDYVKEHAIHFEDVEWKDDDKIAVLSTCAESPTNARAVLYVRLRKRDSK